MGTALIYLIVIAAVAAVLFGTAVVVFGRGEELAPLAPGATPTRLPASDIEGDDVRVLQIPQAVRGYRMAEVDWVLDRLAAELDRGSAELDALRAHIAELEAHAPGRPTTNGVHDESPVPADPAPAESAASDPAMSDPAMSDPAMSDLARSDRAVSERPVPDGSVSDRAVSDGSVSDRAVSDRALSGPAVSGPAVPDPAPEEPVKVDGEGA